MKSSLWALPASVLLASTVSATSTVTTTVTVQNTKLTTVWVTVPAESTAAEPVTTASSTPSSMASSAPSSAPSSSAVVAASVEAVKSLSSSASGVTTRYWDCCKPSCAWSDKGPVTSPVGTCDVNDNPLTDVNTKSGCDGGSAYYCSNQSPWAVSDTLAYGFAAAKLAGKQETDWCCGCYKLTFTSTAIAGKTMIVQATNTGGDLGSNHFDLAMPGGGVGIFNGCSTEWGGIDLGNQYGGFDTRSQCDALPAKWRDGCYWRFDWFENADNPTVEWEEVTCPAELTAKTGCSRT